MAKWVYIIPNHHFLLQCAKHSCLWESAALNQYLHSYVTLLICLRPLMSRDNTVATSVASLWWIRQTFPKSSFCLVRKKLSHFRAVGSIVWPIIEAVFNSKCHGQELVPLAEREVYTELWMSLIWSRELPCTSKMTWLLRQSVMLSCATGSSAATHSESCASPGLWRQGWICGLTRIRKSSSTASWASGSFWAPEHLSICLKLAVVDVQDEQA